MSDRRFAAGVGVVAGVVGLVGVLAPGGVAGLRTTDVVVPLLGVAALAQGVRALGARPDSLRYAELSDPESRRVTVPGTGFDAALAAGSAEVRDRLEAAAVAVLAQFGDGEDQARERLESGTWTDDADAAAFFSPAVEPPASVGDRLRGVLGNHSGVRARARRAVAALAAVVEDDLAPGSTPNDAALAGGGQPDDVSAGTDAAPSNPDPTAIPPPGETTDHPTGRWRGVTALGLFAAAGGTVARSPGLLLVSGVAVALAAYARVATPPTVALDVERELGDPDPSPGDEVAVTLTVRNVGESLLPDLTLVDGVPADLPVTEGTPRRATALRPGEATTLTYAVEAERGSHEFDPVVVLARDVSGAVERATSVAPETTLDCAPPLLAAGRVPLRDQTTSHAGRVATDVGGAGVEFYGTREYRPGDPLGRIDWNRRAKTGDLTTLEFRETRAATVVVVVDAREAARLAPGPDERSAVARSVEGAGAAVASLLDTGERVGVAALAAEPCWLSPGTGRRQRGRARTLLSSHPALYGPGFRSVGGSGSESGPKSGAESGSGYGFESRSGSESRSARGRFLPTAAETRLRRRLPDDAQVVLFSPLGDTYPADLARRLDAAGHLVTVVSPDPTATGSPGRLLARVERSARISSLRAVGVPVIDWTADEPFELALDRARRVG